MADKAFDLIRNLPILETQSTHFLRVLETGSVSTNSTVAIYLPFAFNQRLANCSKSPSTSFMMICSLPSRLDVNNAHVPV